MDLAWNPLGAVGVVVGIACFALAALVYTAPAAREPNRLLGGYLFLHGLYFAIFNGLRLFAVDPRDAYALMIAGHGVANGLSHVLIVGFVATYDSPLVAWMRRFGLRWVVAAPFALVVLHHVVRPDAWVIGVEPLEGSTGWGVIASPLRSLYLLAVTVVLLLCTVPAMDAWRRARSPGARRRAKVLALTFAATNVSWVLFILWYVVFASGPLTPSMVAVNFLWQAANSLAFALGLVYGMVTTQLFDIDLKIKWTLRKGTVAAAFVGVFFVVSEGAQTLFSAQMGPILGLLAAGALVFALAPLQSLADRIGDAAMPSVKDTAEYRTVRKREVYRAAVESALEDGGDISTKERGMLATLAEQLGLGPKEMHDIEREARAARAGVA